MPYLNIYIFVRKTTSIVHFHFLTDISFHLVLEVDKWDSVRSIFLHSFNIPVTKQLIFTDNESCPFNDRNSPCMYEGYLLKLVNTVTPSCGTEVKRAEDVFTRGFNLDQLKLTQSISCLIPVTSCFQRPLIKISRELNSSMVTKLTNIIWSLE